MRNPAIFWSIIAALQFMWLSIGLGAHWWLKPLLPAQATAWLVALLCLLLGDGLLLAFNWLIPNLRWHGTTALLLFAVYAFMLTIACAAIQLLLRQVFDLGVLNHWMRLSVPLAWLAIIGAGLYCAYTPTVVRYEVHIDKPLAKPLNIALVTDTHLGRYIGAHHLRALQRIITEEHADVLLLSGDIMDDVPDVYRKKHMASLLKTIKTPLGQYAVLGNHDNYRGVQTEIVQDLQDAGFTVLRDEHLTVNQQFVLVGRRDKVEQRLGAKQVVPTSALPVLVMDHQPEDFGALANTDADLVLSGHTHKGQVFPATLLIRYFQQFSYGQYQLKQSHLVVSSGLGLWGVPFRLGTQSEVVMIKLIGK